MKFKILQNQSFNAMQSSMVHTVQSRSIQLLWRKLYNVKAANNCVLSDIS